MYCVLGGRSGQDKTTITVWIILYWSITEKSDIREWQVEIAFLLSTDSTQSTCHRITITRNIGLKRGTALLIYIQALHDVFTQSLVGLYVDCLRHVFPKRPMEKQTVRMLWYPIITTEKSIYIMYNMTLLHVSSRLAWTLSSSPEHR